MLWLNTFRSYYTLTGLCGGGAPVGGQVLVFIAMIVRCRLNLCTAVQLFCFAAYHLKQVSDRMRPPASGVAFHAADRVVRIHEDVSHHSQHTSTILTRFMLSPSLFMRFAIIADEASLFR